MSAPTVNLLDFGAPGLSIDLAIATTWALLLERPPEANISNQGMPPWRAHVDFVKRQPHTRWCLIQNEDGDVVGAILVTTRNEIGIGILKRYQRRGYAKAAITKLMEQPPLPAEPGVRSGRYLANINPANTASIALFESLGFKTVQHTLAL